MEKILQKMAKQLNSYDEASLMTLWNKYQQIIQNNPISKDWEEAVLIFSFIQSIRWKNQLFNYKWSQNYHFTPEATNKITKPAIQKKCKIIDFDIKK